MSEYVDKDNIFSISPVLTLFFHTLFERYIPEFQNSVLYS